ncbi:receptor-type tyrosine-protein phosphatase beta-like isoform X2 [Myxocyprinus asiaticus]|uniref:receptor-type tyrosine-protein phosphatase beta-like isoform X2 n=1 Tax=Myxocyprinus asiaticus TaxID=70543 RepID=UPI00222398F4|nr:receptor-type tyrosine-protein phosphatase beta-like isoform X2 [Myxocyprinus asiaticus]
MRIRGYSKTQILQTFQVHCQSLATNDNAGYRQEFEELEDVGREYTCRAGQLDANKKKNRYPFILPYDHTRVQLSLLDSKLHSDYINASYVPGGTSEHDFICTQAPLQCTMVDFWRMIWEKNVPLIVMVTTLREDGKVMCDQYWPPERGTGCYGTLQVTTVSRQRHPEYYITTIRLQQQGFRAVRHVTHYHYPLWPDQGVPQTASSLCTFTEHVRQHLDNITSHGPSVVHCSAGVGRSGTFVALLWLLQLCARGIPPNVRLAVQDLRKRRVMMVQNIEQYILVHQCLLHWLGGETSKPCDSRAAPVSLHHGSRQSTRSRQGRQRRSERTQPTTQDIRHTHQEYTTHSNTTQPSQTSLQSLQTALKSIHPAHLLRRIIPSTHNR